MDIVIFKDLTTSDHIKELKLEAEKYTGLYVDMNEPEQRKYVKEKADNINQLLKKVDRKRIDAAKEYKILVEKEANSIVEDLKIANLPFTLLIDEYKAERKKILDDEKARKQAIIDAEKLELDHEMALLINKTYEYDKAESERIEKEKLALIKEEAENAAAERQKQINKSIEQEKINAENARLTNLDHVREINNGILFVLLKNGINEKDAKTFIRLAAKNEIPNLKINY